MTVAACILGNSAVRLWGIDGATRLERQLRAAGVTRVDRDALPASDSPVLLVRGDHLFDDRLLRDLLARPGTLLATGGGTTATTVVAAHVDVVRAEAARAAMEGLRAAEDVPGVALVTPETLSPTWTGTLQKASAAAVLPIRRERAGELARYLFDGAYKGVTDLVTKWVWPAPARLVTRVCARYGVSPNAVTAASYVLVLAVIALFAQGHFLAGLALAWTMTFLDTVDGKLARVTVTSTRAGHFFDHVLDLVHPPFWYLAWGFGIEGNTVEVCTLKAVFAAIIAGYVVGRLAEGGFDALLAGFPIFSWRPLDSYFRLILARRNPNLLLLTAFAFAGLPREGLVAVAAWTVACSAMLLVRLLQAAWLRARNRPLRSWLAELGGDLSQVPAYARPFATDPAAIRRLID